MVPVYYKKPEAASSQAIQAWLDGYLQLRKRQNPYLLRAAIWVLIVMGMLWTSGFWLN